MEITDVFSGPKTTYDSKKEGRLIDGAGGCSKKKKKKKIMKSIVKKYI